MSKKNLLIVEGETEKKLVTEYRHLLKNPYSIKVLNVCNNYINKQILGKKYDMVAIILDTDLCDNCHFDKILENVKNINASKIEIYLQDKNFEGELVYSSDRIKSENELYRIFNCSSKEEFTNCFISSNNIRYKNLEINFHKFYSRAEMFRIKLEKVLPRRIEIKQGKSFFTRERDKL